MGMISGRSESEGEPAHVHSESRLQRHPERHGSGLTLLANRKDVSFHISKADTTFPRVANRPDGYIMVPFPRSTGKYRLDSCWRRTPPEAVLVIPSEMPLVGPACELFFVR